MLIRNVSCNVNTLCITPAVMAGAMEKHPVDRSERLRIARKRAGYSSASDAARQFGWGESAYRHHENGTRSYGLDLAARYGRAFKVKPGWLLGIPGIDDEPVAALSEAAPLEVGGIVAAGVWREDTAISEPMVIDLPPLVSGSKRLGYIVEGRSMDLVYEPGTVLDCLSVFHGDIQPQAGDHVIVRRTSSDGLRELTVKEYVEREGDFYLVPRSSSPDYREIKVGRPDVDIGHDGEIGIIALVISAIPPRTLELLRRLGKVSGGTNGAV